MPRTSREEVRVDFGTDLTAFDVELAIILESEGEPGDGEYHAAAWDGGEAVLLVGEGSDVELAAGEYVVWTRITAGGQRPVRRSGFLTVGSP